MKLLLLLGLFLTFSVSAAATTSRILPSQDAWPVWSPDGTLIAFTRIDGNVMTLDVLALGRFWSVRTVARNRGQLEESWSADSTKLAYTAGGRVYVWHSADGSREPKGTGIEPALSPDGTRLAVLRGTSLFVGRDRWADGVIGHPQWAPDGRLLAFARETGIYVASGPDTFTLATSAVGEPGSPVWSPDGTLLAYTSGRRVWVAAVDGSASPRAVSAERTNIGPLSWSRNGDALVYTRTGAVEVSRVHGRSTVLARHPGLGAAFDPQVDRVAFAGPRPSCPGHLAIRLLEAGSYPTTLTGSCKVVGTSRSDDIEGSLREGDVILAGAGNDRVHANDGHTDTVNCGPGRDTVWADRTDRLVGCEIVHR